MRTLARVGVTLLMTAVAAVVGYLLWKHYMYSPWTRDARIQANVISIAPDVSGLITEVDARDNEHVSKGQVLFRVDPKRYRLAVARARADLAAARAAADQKQAEARRRAQLSNHVISRETVQSAQAAARVAEAQVHQAQAALDEAELNLKRTQVRAPVDGYVTHLNVHPGDFANTGQSMLALVNSHSFHVEAYFEETKVPGIHPGQSVSIRLMAGGPRLHGQVAGIARAIADSADKGLLANVNPSFQWVRLAQRIPVRIRLTDVPPGLTLSAGMTCTVTVRGQGRHS